MHSTERRWANLILFGCSSWAAAWLVRPTSADIHLFLGCWRYLVAAFCFLYAGALWLNRVPSYLAAVVALAATSAIEFGGDKDLTGTVGLSKAIVMLSLPALLIMWAARQSPVGSHATARRIPVLNGLRGLAIALVLLDHALIPALERGNHIAALVRPGQHGVNLFFFLSGFLITTGLLEREVVSKVSSVKQFYVRRILRILPAATVFLAGALSLALAGVITLSSMDVLPAVMSVRNLDGANRSVLHFWSLSIEEQFYMMFPLALLYLPRRALAGLLLSMAILSGAWRGYLDLHSSTLVSIGLSTRTDLRLDQIAAGCLLALVFQHVRRRNLHCSTWLRHAIVPTALMWLTTVFATRTSSTIYETGLLLALFALLLLHPSSWLTRALCCQPLTWLGRVSYSLYLWQQLFTIAELSPHTLAHYLQSAPLNLLLCLGAAYVSYEFVEKPFQHWRPKAACPFPAELSPQPS